MRIRRLLPAGVPRPTISVLTTLVVIGGVVEHAIYAWTQQSFPRDLNLTYTGLPMLYDQLGRGSWAGVGFEAGREGGWYNLLIALWLHLLGPSGVHFELLAAPGFGLLLAGTALLARSWYGPAAGLATTAIIAQMPLILLSSHLGWIHIPETTLVVWAAWALTLDPGLARWRTVALLTVTGVLAITLRSSGVLWMGVLAVSGVATAVSTRTAGHLRVRRLAILPIALGWGLALLVPLPDFRGYVLGKVDMHDRYAMAVPALLPQLVDHLGPVLGVCVAVGLVASLVASLRPLPSPVPSALRAVLLASWLAGSLVLYAIVRCGLDNFPLFYIGIALLAGDGLARLAPFGIVGRLAVALPVVAALATGSRTALDELTLPRPPLPSTRVAALINAACPERRPSRRCLLLTDQGLFAPRAEEPGQLELFLMDEPFVTLRSVYQPAALYNEPAALGAWTCGADDAIWRQRQPDGDRLRDAVIARWRLAPAQTFLEGGCTFTWWTAR